MQLIDFLVFAIEIVIYCSDPVQWGGGLYTQTFFFQSILAV